MPHGAGRYAERHRLVGNIGYRYPASGCFGDLVIGVDIRGSCQNSQQADLCGMGRWCRRDILLWQKSFAFPGFLSLPQVEQ